MAVDASGLKSLIFAELARMPNERVREHVRTHLVEPKPVLRDWDYGKEGEQFICWSVLERPSSNIAIAYCEQGFGPAASWGLVFLEGPYTSIGADSNWYTTFWQAYFDSRFTSDLPIWRVYKSVGMEDGVPITPQGSWDETWEEVRRFRASDPSAQYDCGTDIPYERE